MRKILLILFLLLFTLTSAACAAATNAVVAFDIYNQATAAMKNIKSLAADTRVKMIMSMNEKEIAVEISGSIKSITISETEVEMQVDMNTIVMGQEIELKAFYKDGVYYVDTEGQKFSMELPIEQMKRQTNIEALSFPVTAIKNQQITKKDNGNELSFTLDGTTLTDAVAAQLGDLSSILSAGVVMSIGDIEYMIFIDKQGNLKTTQMIFSMEVNMLGATVPFSAEINADYVQINDVTIDFPDDLDAYLPMGIQF